MNQPQQSFPQIRKQIENEIIDKIKDIVKDIENQQIQLQASHRKKEKEDVDILVFKSKLQETTSKQSCCKELIFQSFNQVKLADRIRNCQKFPIEKKPATTTFFRNFQTLFNAYSNEQKKIQIKINRYLEQFMHDTIQQIEEIHDDIVRLEQCGICGKQQILNSFDLKYLKLQRYSYLWENLYQLENSDPDYVFKPQWKEKEMRSYLSESFKKYLIEPSNTIIEVQKETVVTKEVPVYLEKIIEKVNRVEVQVPVQVQVEVPKYEQIIKQDEIREAHEHLFGIGRPQNVKLALKIYEEEASKMNPFAFNSLGQLYYEGKHVKQDFEKSYQYYLQSAKLNDPEGLYWAGLYQLKISPPEFEKGINYLKQAAQLGNPDAQTDLGHIFCFGFQKSNIHKRYYYKVSPQIDLAEEYFYMAKKQDYPRAICDLGVFYLNFPDFCSKYNNKNAFENALENFQLAKELGNAQANYYLGQCYEKGYGVLRDSQKAYQIYREGALAGDVECLKVYLPTLEQGPDFANVYNYLRQVLTIHPNLGIAHYLLGVLYDEGKGVNQDYKAAFVQFNKAAQENELKSFEKLGDYYFYGKGMNQNHQEALKMYTLGASMKNSSCMLKTAKIYELGSMQVAQNIDLAVKYYQEAASEKSPEQAEANYRLGLLFQRNDKNRAIEYLETAEKQGSQEAKIELIKVSSSSKEQFIVFEDDWQFLGQDALMQSQMYAATSQVMNKQPKQQGGKQKGFQGSLLVSQMEKSVNPNQLSFELMRIAEKKETIFQNHRRTQLLNLNYTRTRQSTKKESFRLATSTLVTQSKQIKAN